MNKLRLLKCELNNNKIDKMIVFNDYEYRCIKEAYKILDTITLEIAGNNYNEKQENARQLAIDYELFLSEDADIDLSILEYSAIADYFEKIGKRYGLINEFRENAIC